ncbi:MAG: MlaA family lipoprotein [Pelagibacteraceae bacterium]
MQHLGLNNQKEDVGQTLGSYGVGPWMLFCYYLVLGPTTARDTCRDG